MSEKLILLQENLEVRTKFDLDMVEFLKSLRALNFANLNKSIVKDVASSGNLFENSERETARSTKKVF